MVKRGGNKGPLADWTWVGTEAKRAGDITSEHRRRAAGLVGGKPCSYRYKGKKDLGCTQGRCRGSPWCLNQLGAEEVGSCKISLIQLVGPGAKAAYLEKLGPEPRKRAGPAGLRNLGATCYVRPHLDALMQANAFLQLWFHNVAFRNGVYSCLLQEVSNCETPLT
jgi:ubiquitin carboxyl-terminal hydrolase 48